MWINGLDTIRFLLAFGVVISHFGKFPVFEIFESNSLILKICQLIYNNIFTGQIFVVIFFIISGIVIHYSYTILKPLKWYEFIIQRYIRIGIPMIEIVYLSTFFKNREITIVLWSLKYELFFYTIYPILNFISIKIKWQYLFMFFFVLSYMIVLINTPVLKMALNKSYLGFNGNYQNIPYYKSVFIGLPCFILGIIISNNLENILKLKVSIKQLYMARLLIIALIILCSILRFHFHISFMLSLNFFAVFASIWLAFEIIYFNANSPIYFFEQLGKYSFSIYVIHQLSKHIFENYYDLDFSFHFVWILKIVNMFIFSLIFYYIVEFPSHFFAKKIIFNKLQNLRF
ncbi:MAG: hypothetical protein EAZ27_11855 [Cytophagales bacterium]|nr:MAG: hypothetical protein EAZ27_11855 [Cytophagales bacterium]